MQTPKETNHEIKTKRCTFSLFSDIDIEKVNIVKFLKAAFL